LFKVLGKNIVFAAQVPPTHLHSLYVMQGVFHHEPHVCALCNFSAPEPTPRKIVIVGITVIGTGELHELATFLPIR